tara:strand:+ start:217 stop:507 length:291 start_codon:yes stop_codon:yes gene_type:complete
MTNKPTKAQAKQIRLQRQIKQVLTTFEPTRVFSAHDMASAMGEVWKRIPTHREVAHSLIRLGEQNIINRARHYERQAIYGQTNMWSVNPAWLRREA